jgi:phage shock protein PspC (stress-responsive transcriptional regulator)
MDKVFQIHLAGVVFTIEEKAYDKLKVYTLNLRQHFASNSDVVQDIESRMAELLHQRLGSNRTTLFLEDVDSVMSTLGNINQMDDHGHASQTQGAPAYTPPTPKKLRRDPYDQSLGGVCSGLASFFDVDPVLIRVLFVVLLVAFGGGILAYLILWIAVPEAKGEEAFQMRLQRENKTKKLFRDNDARVVSGVASGLANYFGLDVVWIRVAFLVSILVFGTGFWLYVILWIIIPKAVTASDKLLMKGRSVDIHSIQQQVIENQGGNKVNSISQHGSHIFGIVIKGVLKLIGAFAALLLFIIVLSISVAMVAVFFNLGDTHQINELIQFTIKNQSIIVAAKAGVFLVLITPAIALLMFVIKALFGLTFDNKAWFFSLLGVFVFGVVSLIYAGLSFGASIRHNESKSQVMRLTANDTLYLEGVEMPFNENVDDIENMGELAFLDKGLVISKTGVHIEIDKTKIRSGKGDSIYLKIIKRGNGKDKENALEKIEMINYNISIENNKLTIPSFFTLNKDQQFSWQEVDVVLIVPQGTVIHLDDISKENLYEEYMDEADGHFYKITEDGLTCLDCVAEE